MLVHSKTNKIVTLGLSMLILIGVVHPAASSVSIGGELVEEVVEYVDLKVAKGRLTGEINNKPVRYLLERLSRLGYLEFKGKEDILLHRISAEFKDVSYQEALEKVLDSYNYLIIAGQEDKPLYYIVGLRGDYVADRAKITAGIKKIDPSPLNGDTWGDSTGLSNEQREAFADGKKIFARSHSDFNPGVEINSEEQRKVFANDQVKLQENHREFQESMWVVSAKQREAFAADQKQINENQNELNMNIGEITDQQREVIENHNK